MGIAYQECLKIAIFGIILLFSSACLAIEDGKLKTPQSETEEVIAHLKNNIKPEDYIYTKYLTTYAIPENKREDYVLCASFILHSLIGPPNPDEDINLRNYGGFSPLAIRGENKFFVPRQKVPGSDTLWYFDLRDYNLTPQAWEKAALLDAYFAEPIVQPPTSGALRLLAGNALLRLDWFIANVIDSTKQSDNDIKINLYDEFVFANVGVPKTETEWWAKIQFDPVLARKIGNASYALVTKSEAVARHNRILEEFRTQYGYGYETYDTKNEQGFRDYVESFFKEKNPGGPPSVSDAGEIFASNPVGLQIYALRDINEKLINFGDPTVVRHVRDVLGDVRVRNPYSCFDCHASGPLPSENTISEFLRSQGKLYLKNRVDENRVKRNYLNKRFEISIKENQDFFANRLKLTNGLEPEENNAIFLDLVGWYNSPVNVERAALECGVSIDEFKKKVVEGKSGGRLKLLVQNNESISIESWETRGKDGIPGQFQQAMIKIYGLTKITEEENVAILESSSYETIVDCPIQNGQKIVGTLKAGEKIVIDGEPRIQDGWIKYGAGWINLKNVKPLSK
jgi:hypothetical protein